LSGRDKAFTLYEVQYLRLDAHPLGNWLNDLRFHRYGKGPVAQQNKVLLHILPPRGQTAVFHLYLMLVADR